MSDRSHHGTASHASLLAQEARTANHDNHAHWATAASFVHQSAYWIVAHFDETARSTTDRMGRAGQFVQRSVAYSTHDHQIYHPLLPQHRHNPNHAPTRGHPATSDPTESWYSPPMPRTGVDHAGALYGRVYGDPD